MLNCDLFLGSVRYLDKTITYGVIVNEFKENQHSFLLVCQDENDHKIGAVADDIIIEYCGCYNNDVFQVGKVLKIGDVHGNFETNEVRRILDITDDGDENTSTTAMYYRELLEYGLNYFSNEIKKIIKERL